MMAGSMATADYGWQISTWRCEPDGLEYSAQGAGLFYNGKNGEWKLKGFQNPPMPADNFERKQARRRGIDLTCLR